MERMTPPRKQEIERRQALVKQILSKQGEAVDGPHPLSPTAVGESGLTMSGSLSELQWATPSRRLEPSQIGAYNGSDPGGQRKARTAAVWTERRERNDRR